MHGNVVVTGLAHTFGWMRRPELETHPLCWVWEKPDGRLLEYPSGHEPMVHRLAAPLCRDIRTSPVPGACSKRGRPIG